MNAIVMRFCVACYYQQQKNSDAEHAVGDIEGGPVHILVMHVDEIAHHAVIENAVIGIAQNARKNNASATVSRRSVSAQKEKAQNGNRRDKRNRHTRRRSLAACNAESRAGIFLNDHPQKSVYNNVDGRICIREPFENSLFCPQVKRQAENDYRPENKMVSRTDK